MDMVRGLAFGGSAYHRDRHCFFIGYGTGMVSPGNEKFVECFWKSTIVILLENHGNFRIDRQRNDMRLTIWYNAIAA
jgi:hypothetical protein